MKVLQIHNEYMFKGGEDVVIENERKLLQKKNIQVYQIIRKNSEESKTIKDKISIFKNLSYSKISLNIIEDNIKRFGNPDVVHVHNIFPLWTFSILDYFKYKKIPIVMTLHNFRLMFAKMRILKKKEYEKYGLFKNSYYKTYLIFKLFNKNIKFLNNVDTFIALNNFAKEEFISIGIPEEKIKIKPNFIPEKNLDIETSESKKNKINFICTSRLSNEKGLDTLIKCWENMNYELKLFGEGPLARDTKRKNIKYYGKKKFEEIIPHLKSSNALILPSKLNEGGLPLSVIEAFQNEVLVIASNLGSMKSEIKDKFNGILFEMGNEIDLQKKIEWSINNPDMCKKIIQNAKLEFNSKYTEEKNFQTLIDIYEKASQKN